VYTATVGLPSSNSGPAGPTGWVEFLDHGRAIKTCLKRPLKRLSATCTMKYKTVGQHKISALYSGDANFGGSRSAARTVRIIRGKPGPLVLGFVSSVLQWQFTYHPHYTLVTGLRADDLVKGMTVVLGCQGGGCPFSRVSIPVRGGTSVDLLSRFHRRHLPVGTQITLWMTRPHWVGKYYSFTVRAGQGPEIALSCLGVGSLRPGVGC
jgi:Bacterial Ig-like domain (group 3)